MINLCHSRQLFGGDKIEVFRGFFGTHYFNHETELFLSDGHNLTDHEVKTLKAINPITFFNYGIPMLIDDTDFDVVILSINNGSGFIKDTLFGVGSYRGGDTLLLGFEDLILIRRVTSTRKRVIGLGR